MSKHTDVPWEVHDGFSNSPTICKRHADDTCHIIAELGVTEGVRGHQVRADAEHIVRCVNHFDGLLSACKGIYASGGEADETNQTVTLVMSFGAMARLADAIAKAE